MLAPTLWLPDTGGFLRGWGMGRPGRRRESRARFRGGRLKPRRKEIDERTRIARSQPHRRDLRSHDRSSQMAESALGRLALRRVVTPAAHAAGEAFAAIVAKYRATIEAPRGMRSLMPEVAPERADPDEQQVSARFSCPVAHGDAVERDITVGGQKLRMRVWPCQQPGETCACAERRARYMRTYEAIAAAGRRALLAVIAVAVRGEELPASERVYLMAGLRAAAAHLGLTELDRRR